MGANGAGAAGVGAAGVAAIGVDAGSTTWKAVAVDAAGKVVASTVEPAEPRIDQQTQRALAALRLRAPAGPDVPIGATGYGRKRVPGARQVTEITCHARGAFAQVGRPHVLLDMGGQDTKVIRVEAGGKVGDFVMNDKCAAGTGRFLEVILSRLRVPLEEVAARAAAAARTVPVSSTCTVFAESEVVSLLAGDEPLEGIVKGVHVALASRVATLASRLAQGCDVYMSGGVAQNGAMVSALADALRRPILVLEQPQLVGALGAALAVK